MFVLFLSFIILALTSGSVVQKWDPFKKDPHFEHLSNFKALAHALQKSDYLMGIVFYSDSERSRFLIDKFKEFSEESHDFMKFYAIDCDEIREHPEDMENIVTCKDEYKDRLPGLTFFE